MYISKSLYLLAAASTAQAFSLPEVHLPDTAKWTHNIKTGLSTLKARFQPKPRATCPPVWNDISTELTGVFLADGQCTDAARAAIRLAFHDCFNGACDGSIILAQEYNYPENNGLQRVAGNLAQVAQNFSVGVADVVQFAGMHAIKTCPRGPTVRTWIGRTDSSDPAPQGALPDVHASADTLVAQFAAKGFSARDLAALLGAHSTAKQQFVDPSKAGTSLDTTPGIWDVRYYSQTLLNLAPFRLPSDIALSKHRSVGPQFRSFVFNQFGWGSAFSSAMERMSLIGVDQSNLVDCTNALPKGSFRLF